MSKTLCRLLAWGLILLLALTGCQLKQLPGGLPGTGLPQDGISQTIPFILGNVADALGQPVEGATVRAYVAPYQIAGLSTDPQPSVQATTDAKGSFRLQAPPLGNVTVEALGHGQKAMRMGVTVAQGANVELGTLSLLPTGRLAGRVTAPQGTALLGTDVFIPGTDYLAKTAADGSYLLQDVPAGTYQVAAIRPNFQPRVLDGIAVRSGETTPVPDLELSLDAPVLTSLDPTSGGPGTVITLRGANFGASRQTMLQVTFGDTLATTVKRLSDTEIQATVPVGAGSGVIVRSNGIASALKAFSVITSLSVSPSSLILYPGATASFAFRALDSRGEDVPDPFVVWALRDSSIGTVGAQGTFEALGTGVTELSGRSGTTGALNWIGVSPFQASTLYGTGLNARAGDGGPAGSASFNNPYSLAQDAAGNLYVAEQTATIRRIAPDGTIVRFAGNGTRGWSGDGGPALQASMGSFPTLAVDEQNRLWFADADYHVLRFMPLDDRAAPTYRAGYIYRGAGTGAPGYSGSGSVGPNAAFAAPMRVTAAPEGLYVADKLNHRIRLVDAQFKVTDVLGTGSFLQLPAPAPAAEAAIGNPVEVALDTHGMLVSTLNQLLYWCRVTGPHLGRPMDAGMVYPLAQVDGSKAYHGDGAAVQVTLQSTAHGLTPDGEGGFWFLHGFLVRHLTPNGRIETIAGKPMEQATKQALGADGDGRNALRFSLASPGDMIRVGDRLLVAETSYCRIVQLERVPQAP